MRSHHCGELNESNENQNVTLCGWVSKIRDMGKMAFIDLRDRHGITQLAFNEQTNTELLEFSRTLGREFVIKAVGTVVKRSSINPNIPTGSIEILVSELEILNESALPPFLIENDTDGKEELRYAIS